MEVTIYGRWLYLVDSESRPELRHLVDLEPELDDHGRLVPGGQPWRCSCEAHYYKVTQPCKHVRAVLAYMRPVFAYMAAFAPVGENTTSYQTKRRVYILDRNKTYDPTKTNPPTPARGLHPRLHSQPAGAADNGGPGLDGHAARRRRARVSDLVH